MGGGQRRLAPRPAAGRGRGAAGKQGTACRQDSGGFFREAEWEFAIMSVRRRPLRSLRRGPAFCRAARAGRRGLSCVPRRRPPPPPRGRDRRARRPCSGNRGRAAASRPAPSCPAPLPAAPRCPLRRQAPLRARPFLPAPPPRLYFERPCRQGRVEPARILQFFPPPPPSSARSLIAAKSPAIRFLSSSARPDRQARPSICLPMRPITSWHSRTRAADRRASIRSAARTASPSTAPLFASRNRVTPKSGHIDMPKRGFGAADATPPSPPVRAAGPGIMGTRRKRRGARIRQKVFAIQGSALFSGFGSAPFRRWAARPRRSRAPQSFLPYCGMPDAPRKRRGARAGTPYTRFIFDRDREKPLQKPGWLPYRAECVRPHSPQRPGTRASGRASTHPSMPRVAAAPLCGAGSSGGAATCALLFKVFSEKIVNLALVPCRCRLDYTVDVKPSSSVVPVVLFHNLMT